jgi:hypothetical protein
MSVWAKTQREDDGQQPDISLHRRVELESDQWCREFKGTVFSWLRGIMHLSSQFVMTQSPIGRFVYAGNDVFILDGQRITLADWKTMIKTFMDELPATFKELCNFVGVDDSNMELPGEIRDVPDSLSAGYWFGSEERNDLQEKATKFTINALNGEPLLRIYPPPSFVLNMS